jgi:hypothetical protein
VIELGCAIGRQARDSFLWKRRREGGDALPDGTVIVRELDRCRSPAAGPSPGVSPECTTDARTLHAVEDPEQLTFERGRKVVQTQYCCIEIK